MQQWLDLIPVVGALLTLAANVINLTTALVVRRDAAQVRGTTPSHARPAESAILAEPGEVPPAAQDDGQLAFR